MIKFPRMKGKNKKAGRPSVLAGLRSASYANRYSDFNDEEKKEDEGEVAPFNMASAVAGSAMAAKTRDDLNDSDDIDDENIRDSDVPCPAQLAICFDHELDDDVEAMLRLGNEKAAVMGDKQGSEENDCMLFEDEENNSLENGLRSVELPAQLLSAVPSHKASPTREHSKTFSSRTQGLPTEINIDIHAVPPSPIRDPSVAYLNYHDAPPNDLLQPYNNYANSGDGVNAKSNKVSEDSIIRTQLCDAERLVRVILGKTAPDKPLENGSILQAIRSYAVMQQELIDLRKRVENIDGDPPAILTNLTSPATTKNSSSLSTPAKSSPPSIPRMIPAQSALSPDTESSDEQQLQTLRTTRNALVLAAKKCQLLETQLRRANETIEHQQRELEERESDDTENVNVGNAQRQQATRSRKENEASDSNLPSDAEIENFLSKLRSLPSKAKSHADRQQIRQRVSDWLQQAVDMRNDRSLLQFQRREQLANQKLEIAQEQIETLQSQLHLANKFLLHRNDVEQEMSVPDPMIEARHQIRQKDERIAELEASQMRLQSLLEMTIAKSHPLQESSATKSAAQSSSQRLRQLQKEHMALAESMEEWEGPAEF